MAGTTSPVWPDRPGALGRQSTQTRLTRGSSKRLSLTDDGVMEEETPRRWRRPGLASEESAKRLLGATGLGEGGKRPRPVMLGGTGQLVSGSRKSLDIGDTVRLSGGSSKQLLNTGSIESSFRPAPPMMLGATKLISGSRKSLDIGDNGRLPGGSSKQLLNTPGTESSVRPVPVMLSETRRLVSGSRKSLDIGDSGKLSGGSSRHLLSTPGTESSFRPAPPVMLAATKKLVSGSRGNLDLDDSGRLSGTARLSGGSSRHLLNTTGPQSSFKPAPVMLGQVGHRLSQGSFGSIDLSDSGRTGSTAGSSSYKRAALSNSDGPHAVIGPNTSNAAGQGRAQRTESQRRLKLLMTPTHIDPVKNVIPEE